MRTGRQTMHDHRQNVPQHNKEPPAHMQTVVSQDGTRIALWRSGQGPPLLLIHGAVADHATTWRLVRPALERRFTVYAMDRRGRGGSGDDDHYALDREAEDVASVIDAIGGPVDVLGHSYGALCALEASLLTRGVRKLVLYEGVPVRGADAVDHEIIDGLEALLAAGEVEEMLVTFLEAAGASRDEIDIMRAQPDAWLRRIANTTTIPRELRAEYEYVFVPDRFVQLQASTLLLVGGDSPAREAENAEAVASALRDAHVSILRGQQHLAMYTAPDAFADVVAHFLAGGAA